MSQKSHQILISTGLGILVGAGLTKLYERIKHQHEKTKMNFTSSNNTPTQGIICFGAKPDKISR